MLKRVFMFAAAALALTLPGAAQEPTAFERAHAADVNNCLNPQSPAQNKIAGCTALLNAGRDSQQLNQGQVAQVLATRAMAYAVLRQHEPALADADDAIRLLPKNAGLLFLRGNIFFDASKPAEAITAYTASIELDAKDPNVYYQRARAYNLVRREYWAIKDFDQALAIKPDLTPARAARAHTYALIGEYAKALTDLNAVLATDPKDIYALRTKAGILLSSTDSSIRDIKQSMTLAQRAYQLNINSNTSMNVLAMAYAAGGELDAALTLFDIGMKRARPDRVMSYQRYLRHKGFYDGPFDGLHSPVLLAAIGACLKEQCLNLFE